MTGGESIFYAFAAMTAIASTAMMIAGVATPGWFELHSGHFHQRVGYFRFCNITGGPIPTEDCFAAPFKTDKSDEGWPFGGIAGDYTSQFCPMSSSSKTLSQGLGAALGLIGAAFMLAIAFLMLFGWCCRRFTNLVSIIGIVLSGVSIGLFVASIVIICVFFEKSYYCDTNFCTFAKEKWGARDCTFFYGYSFVYAIIATILALVVMCVLIGLLVHHCSNPKSAAERIAEAEAKEAEHSRLVQKRRREEEQDEEEEDEEMVQTRKHNASAASSHHTHQQHQSQLNETTTSRNPYGTAAANRSAAAINESTASSSYAVNRNNNNNNASNVSVARSNHAPDAGSTPQQHISAINHLAVSPSSSSYAAVANQSTATNKKLHFEDELNQNNNINQTTHNGSSSRNGSVLRSSSRRNSLTRSNANDTNNVSAIPREEFNASQYDLQKAPPLPRGRGGGGGGARNRAPPTAMGTEHDNFDGREEDPLGVSYRDAPTRSASRDVSPTRSSSNTNIVIAREANRSASGSRRASPARASTSTSVQHQRSSSSAAVDVRSSSSAVLAEDTSSSSNKLGFWPSDWVFHTQSQLYWSASQQLYLDPKTEHYFDPHSNKWYDPKRDVWYSKDDE